MAEATATSPAREDASIAPDPAQQIAESFKPLTRPPLRFNSGVLAAAAVVLVTLGFLGYRLYEMLSYTDIPVSKVRLSPPVSGEVQLRGPAQAAGDGSRRAAPVEAPVAKPDRGAASPRPVETAADDAPAQPSTSPAATRRSSQQDIAATATESAAKQPGIAPAAPRRASQPAAAARQPAVLEPLRLEPCTDAMAVLGLCTAAPGQAATARTAPSRASSAGKAVDPGAAACTAAVAALGLCAPASNEKRE